MHLKYCWKLSLVPTKRLSKSHEILIYISTADVQSRLKLNLRNFRGISEIVLILLLGASKSCKQFSTAEYKKSQK